MSFNVRLGYRSGLDILYSDWSAPAESTIEYWWPGYSPYDIDYSDEFKTLLDALLVFEDDTRFSEHLVCLSKIFDVDKNILHRDFTLMKDLKAKKTVMVQRKGEHFNGRFSLVNLPFSLSIGDS